MGKPLHETLVALLPEFNQGEDGVFDDTSHTLASQLSEAELQQTLTFFQSPAGKLNTRRRRRPCSPSSASPAACGARS